ncbi:transposase [Rhizobium sp. SSA_523]|uniref:transposase n=1 Tax=Rhizobium sp. SSA_523 TaxID=2952477 RepID=UPI00339DA5B8
MSNEYRQVELLTGDVRRRRWTTEQKLTIIEQSFEPGGSTPSTGRSSPGRRSPTRASPALTCAI